MKIRLHIREQLCILIALTNLVALTVVLVSIWTQVVQHMRAGRGETLAVIANLKATQVAQAISLFRDSVRSISTRENLQSYIVQYNSGDHSDNLIENIQRNLNNALSGGGEDDAVFLQAAVYPHSAQEDGQYQAIAKVTRSTALQQVLLPYGYQNGSAAYLGDDDIGYPPQLFPNLTVPDQGSDPSVVWYDDRPFTFNSTLLLGPMFLQNNQSLISMTLSMNNNTSRSDNLGWLTIVLDAKVLSNVVDSKVALGRTGEVVIIGPNEPDNLFVGQVAGRSEAENANVPLQFILPPHSDRHPQRTQNPYLPFPMDDFPAALTAWSQETGELNNAGSLMSTRNEEGRHIACGFARVPSNIVDWVIVFDQAYGEVNSPITKLQNAVLAVGLSVVGAIIIVCFAIAHYAVKPIRALKTATENSIMTYEAYVPSEKSETGTENSGLDGAVAKDKCFTQAVVRKTARTKSRPRQIRSFQIPEKVPDRRHIIHDELTDLTSTFNDMADELSLQYRRLEDRVKTRTAELEQSRNAARSANEAKTLFIANVSHELRTPLNGVIGMCAVAMQEKDVTRIRQSLNIIYKSSDLLLHLLNDLLTFSRSSYGQRLAIEEGTFRLVDIGSQLVSIFEKQARDADVSLRVVFIGTEAEQPRQSDDDSLDDAIVARQDFSTPQPKMNPSLLAQGPPGTGPLRGLGLKGDKNRILQVLMNLVSNSLKFTPAKGMIEIRIRYRQLVPAGSMPDIAYSNRNNTSTTSGDPSKPAEEIPLGSTQQDSSQMGLAFDFEVEDTGPGIPDHLQEEIFKPFVQGDLALSRKHGGTGLGLAICAQLSEMMGGAITLKSTVDIGSTFTLSLPLRYTKEAVPSVSGSLALAQSSKAPSMSSSVRFETFSKGSRRPRDSRSTQSARTSLYSQSHDTQLDASRLGGFSPPYLVHEADAEGPEAPNGISGSRNRRANEHSRSSRPALAPIQSVGTPLTPGLGPDYGLKCNEDGAEATPQPTPSFSSSKPNFSRVLVAEDNSVNQQVIVRLLELEKVGDVVMAEDGEEALTKVSDAIAESAARGEDAQSFSLILMDIQMPKMDGIEATRRIRELGFKAPIVALTAFDHETNRKACHDAGMDGFLPKPIKRTALKKVLAEFTSSENGATNST